MAPPPRSQPGAARTRGTSGAMKADSRQTDFCGYLSVILLGGLLLNALFGLWWADPLAGLVMAPIIAKEGIEGLGGKRSCSDCGEWNGAPGWPEEPRTRRAAQHRNLILGSSLVPGVYGLETNRRSEGLAAPDVWPHHTSGPRISKTNEPFITVSNYRSIGNLDYAATVCGSPFMPFLCAAVTRQFAKFGVHAAYTSQRTQRENGNIHRGIPPYVIVYSTSVPGPFAIRPNRWTCVLYGLSFLSTRV